MAKSALQKELGRIKAADKVRGKVLGASRDVDAVIERVLGIRGRDVTARGNTDLRIVADLLTDAKRLLNSCKVDEYFGREAVKAAEAAKKAARRTARRATGA